MLDVRTRSISATRLVFIQIAWLIDKIVASRIQIIHKWLLKNRHTHDLSLFSANLKLKASSDLSTSKLRLVRQ